MQERRARSPEDAGRRIEISGTNRDEKSVDGCGPGPSPSTRWCCTRRSPAARRPGGAIATRLDLPGTFALAGALLLAATAAGIWLPLHSTDVGDRTAEPYEDLPTEAIGADQPLEVVIHYRVSAGRRDAFVEAMEHLRTSRLRTGASTTSPKQWSRRNTCSS